MIFLYFDNDGSYGVIYDIMMMMMTITLLMAMVIMMMLIKVVTMKVKRVV